MYSIPRFCGNNLAVIPPTNTGKHKVMDLKIWDPFFGFFSKKLCYKIQLYTGLHNLLKQGARFPRRLIAAEYVITLTSVLVTAYTQQFSIIAHTIILN